MIAAVVILYNTNNNIVNNISSYIDFVDKIYLIDNSDFSNSNLFEDYQFNGKLHYHSNNGNLGIATALNIGCELALKNGFKWVLTMDQDSKFAKLSEAAKNQILNCTDNTIALFYPNYEIEGVLYDKYIREDNEPIVVMTSGNFINLDIYAKLKGFEDKLFIDYVDVDYCLKVRGAGYKIANLSDLILIHELGFSKHISILNMKMIVTNHSKLRRYYITRNRLFVRKKYKNISAVFNKTEKRVFMNDILKIIFFEQDRIQKLKSIIRGYIDYRKDNFGASIE